MFLILSKKKKKRKSHRYYSSIWRSNSIKLAKFLHDNKLPILGTQYTSIDLVEDRDRFRSLLNKLKLKQAKSGIAKNFRQAINIAEKIGLPLMVRPSYVLGGRAGKSYMKKVNLKTLLKKL